MKRKITIYTDGACQDNPGKGGWAAILLEGDRQKEISGYEPLTTNNRMEMTAVIKALEQLKYSCEVSIYTDSAYLCNAFLLGWIDSWKKNNWKTHQKKAVKNQDLWIKLDELSQKHDISFIKVKGHSGNQLNERCDFLATHAIQ